MRYFIYPIFIFSLLLALSSCDDKHAPSVNTTPQKFEASLAEKTYAQLTDEEKWAFVLELIAQKHSNKETVDKWVLSKIDFLISSDEASKNNHLYKINKALFFSELSHSSSAIANKTIQQDFAKIGLAAFNTAAVNLSTHYALLNQSDSLIKYINLLDQTLPRDTIAWHKLQHFQNKAHLAQMEGKYFEAIVLLEKGREYIPNDDSTNLSMYYQNTSEMYLKMEYYDNAQKYADSLVDISQFKDLDITKLNLLGSVFSKVDRLDDAKIYFEEAILKAKQKNMPLLLAMSYSNYGNLHRKLNRYDKAIQYMGMSDSICLNMGISYGILINKVNRAEVYFNDKAFKKAENELYEADSLLHQFNIPQILKEYYSLLYKIHDSLNNPIEANQYHRKYIEYKEEYIGDLPKSVIIAWELARAKEKFSAGESAHQKYIQQQKTTVFIIFSVLLFLVFASIIVYLYNKRKNSLLREQLNLEKQQLAHQVALQSRELIADSIKNLTINTVKQEINQELQSIIGSLPKTQQTKFNKLTLSLETKAAQSFLDEFDKRFVNVNEEFYDKLKKKAPDITPNELRVCALINLNISTKEIAIITNRSIGTIENIRISIRKKLQLDNDANLQKELMNI